MRESIKLVPTSLHSPGVRSTTCESFCNGIHVMTLKYRDVLLHLKGPEETRVLANGMNDQVLALNPQVCCPRLDVLGRSCSG